MKKSKTLLNQTQREFMCYLRILGIPCILMIASQCVMGQTSFRNAIYSEATSHLRGNASANITFETYWGKTLHAVGFDYLYAIKNPERAFQKSKLNYGINYKVGYNLFSTK